MSNKLSRTPLLYTPGNQPQGLGKSTQFSLKDAVTFSIGAESAETLRRFGFSDAEASDLIYYGFWKYRISGVTEQHAEGHAVFNSVTDAFSVFTTGAMPIQISMNGYLYTDRLQDHRMDFFQLYHNKMRGTLLRKHKFVIVLMLKDTVMRLRLQGINVAYTSQLTDWTSMSLQGVAFSYGVKGIAVAAADMASPGDQAQVGSALGTPLSDPDIVVV